MRVDFWRHFFGRSKSAVQINPHTDNEPIYFTDCSTPFTQATSEFSGATGYCPIGPTGATGYMTTAMPMTTPPPPPPPPEPLLNVDDNKRIINLD